MTNATACAPGTLTGTLIALGFQEEQTGGGCVLMGFRFPSGAYVWASAADGCFNPTDDDWMICAYPADDDDAPEAIFTACSEDEDGLSAEIALRAACNVAASPEPQRFAIAVKWAQAIGLGFNPDTPSDGYEPPLTAEQMAAYDIDIAELCQSFDPYKVVLAAWGALGLLGKEG